MQTLVLTALTMVAFAANSVLSRLALRTTDIDPASYVLIRLVSGAVILTLLAIVTRRQAGIAAPGGSWLSALMLFSYAAAFSFAYLGLDTGTGALILFATVQGTMIGWSLYRGDRPGFYEWVGLALAVAASVWLVSPGVTAPDPFHALLMAVAGVSWGVYSIRGKSSADPLLATSGNFLRAVPLAVGLSALFFRTASFPPAGVALAVLSGAVTSGLGYALWYRVLKSLTSMQGGMVQLSVPAIATAGGIAFLSEPLTWRFVICSFLILGGIGFAITAKLKLRTAPV